MVKQNYYDLFSPINNYISKIIPLDFKNKEFSYSNLRKKIQDNQYDLVLDLQNNLRSRLITAGIKNKIYRYNKHVVKRWLYVHLRRKGYPEKPVAEKYVDVLPIEKFKLVPFHLTSWPVEEDVAACREKLERFTQAGEKPFILIFPGARHNTKRWPAEYYIKFIQLIKKRYSVNIFLHGDAGERELCGSIASKAGNGVFNLAGLFSLKESFVLTSLAQFVISNDSAPMHMAALFRKPQIAFFGSTTRAFGFFPLNPNATVLENNDISCRPCSHLGYKQCPRKHFRCMREILPEMAMDVFVEKFDDLL